jgi:hypothetical protein
MVNIMRKMTARTAAAAAFLALLACPPAAPAGQVSAGASVSNGGIDSFFVAIGDHYRVSPRLVVDYRNRYKLADDEWPVVFFLAARAQVGPQVVIDLRLGRRSWIDITVQLGLSPDIFFVPVGLEKIGPPYGNAYGYYRNHGRGGDWRGYKPSDREVVDLVDLRFLSEFHHLAPEEIMSRRGRGQSFVKIHGEVGRGKGPDGQAKGPKGGNSGKGNKKK